MLDTDNLYYYIIYSGNNIGYFKINDANWVPGSTPIPPVIIPIMPPVNSLEEVLRNVPESNIIIKYMD